MADQMFSKRIGPMLENSTSPNDKRGKLQLQKIDMILKFVERKVMRKRVSDDQEIARRKTFYPELLIRRPMILMWFFKQDQKSFMEQVNPI